MAWLRRRREPPSLAALRVEFDFHTLARYNAERSRGIQHTAQWQQRMVELQARFNADAAAERRERG